MTSALLALLLTADAGLPAIYGSWREGPALVPVAKCVYGACEVGMDTAGGITLAPLDWPFEVENLGYLMSFNRSARIACFIGACEKSRELVIDAHASEDAPVPWQLWAGGVVGAFVLGFTVARLLPPPR